MNLKKGLPPIAGKDATVLILGSMPGEESLLKNQYYAHSRNSFWRIMGILFGFDPGLNYKDRIDIIKEHKIALWDVLKACERQGSLDTAIRDETIIENDFISFYKIFPGIRKVFFNGAKAEKEYSKRVLSGLSGMGHEIKYSRLPSTSPAMNQLPVDKKLLQWSRINSKI